MGNYAEELAYWYLRLNGFFVIENFVIHRLEKEEALEYPSDADLLAVRFPNIKEIIGEAAITFDKNMVLKFNLSKILGLIVEVKSSEKPTPIKIFNNDYRMRYAMNRLGILENSQIDGLVSDKGWKKKDIEDGNDKYQVGKLLIHDWKKVHLDVNSEVLSLTEIKEFIIDRLNTFGLEKYGDRIFFPSSLMQYLIWERSKSS